MPSEAVSEAPLSLLFLNMKLDGFEGPERDLPSPKVTQQGRDLDRGRGTRWAGSPALSPWSPGEPGPQLRGRTERKGEGSCRACVEMVQQAGRRVPSPGTPNCRQSQAEVTCFAEPAQQVPCGPPSPSEPSEAGVLLAAAVWKQTPGSAGQWRCLWRPPHSDEPLLGWQLEVGGRWRTGTHLLLTAGPVGAFCLPLLPQFPHQQHQPHGQEQGGQEGEDHNDGSGGLRRLPERGQV